MADKLTKDALRADLIAVFRQYAQPDVAVTESSHITGDLGIDSLSVMEMVAELEDKFQLTFPDDELPSMRTVGDVVRALERKLEAQGRLA